MSDMLQRLERAAADDGIARQLIGGHWLAVMAAPDGQLTYSYDGQVIDHLDALNIMEGNKPSKVRWRPTEPNREPAYRRLYERIRTQDGCITWLLVELRALQKRVNQLETWRARTYSEMVDPTLSANRQLVELDGGPPLQD